MVSASHDESLQNFDVLKRDATSMIGRGSEPATHGPGLVRRLVKSRRFDPALRKELVTEAAYTAHLNCERCPRAEIVRLEDGEMELAYDHSDGVEVDRFLDALDRSSFVLTPIAAAALLSEVFHAVDHIAQHPWTPADGSLRGHGEIEPRSIILGRDGFGRLYETRFACSGFRSSVSTLGTLCRAPELVANPSARTTEGDVYSLGAVLAIALFGPSALIGPSVEPALIAVERAQKSRPGLVPASVIAVLQRALAIDPAQRFASAEALRGALRHGLDLEFSRWRLTIEGLAALSEALASDRGQHEIPRDLLAAYPSVTEEVPPILDGIVLPASSESKHLVNAPVVTDHAVIALARIRPRTISVASRIPPEQSDPALLGSFEDPIRSPFLVEKTNPGAKLDHSTAEPAPAVETVFDQRAAAFLASKSSEPDVQVTAAVPLQVPVVEPVAAVAPVAVTAVAAAVAPTPKTFHEEPTPAVRTQVPTPIPIVAEEPWSDRSDPWRADALAETPNLLGAQPISIDEPLAVPPAETPAALAAQPIDPPPPAAVLAAPPGRQSREVTSPTPVVAYPYLKSRSRGTIAAVIGFVVVLGAVAFVVIGAPQKKVVVEQLPMRSPHVKAVEVTNQLAPPEVPVAPPAPEPPAPPPPAAEAAQPEAAPDPAPPPPVEEITPAPDPKPLSPPAKTRQKKASAVAVKAAALPEAAPLELPPIPTLKEPPAAIPAAAPVATLPEPKPEPVTTTTGRVVINVLPWGNVFFDDRPAGYPPVVLENVAKGVHQIRVQRDGYKTIEHSIVIEPGEDERVHLKLETEPAP